VAFDARSNSFAHVAHRGSASGHARCYDQIFPTVTEHADMNAFHAQNTYAICLAQGRLVGMLAKRFGSSGHDLALISGTLRQVRLYRHMGFKPFGPQVGTPQAPYQPMYLDLSSYAELVVRLARIARRGDRV
jgi:hypothetical protein